MATEKDHLYEVETEVSALNENNLLKPYAYQNLIAQIAEKHLNKISLNIETTMKYNLAWALISLSFEIIQPVKGCVKMNASTWHSQRRGPFFRREIVFKNDKGEVMFHGSTFSVLLDMKKRTIYRKKALPFFINDPIEEYTIEASPSFKIDLDFEIVDKRRVYGSYIDCLGHVNNSRYGEFAYDAFTNDEREKLYRLKRMDINFISELRSEDSFSILKAKDLNKLFIRGCSDVKETPSFNIMMEFY